MRWPNRHPHVLTAGMREAQRAIAGFLPLIEWTCFRRRNLNEEIKVTGFHAFCCADERQAVLWLVRGRSLALDGRVRRDAEPLPAAVAIPGLGDRAYRIDSWDTVAERVVATRVARPEGGILRFTSEPIVADRAFAITPA